MLERFAQRLYDRRHEAVVVPFRQCSLSEWEPTEGQRHHNADYWALSNPTHKAVRGWLVFDFSNAWLLGLRAVFRFTAHSIIDDGTGTLFDLTPSQASQRYPFLRHEGLEGEFISLVEDHGIVHIDHPFEI
jgi:hypothetical protein